MIPKTKNFIFTVLGILALGLAHTLMGQTVSIGFLKIVNFDGTNYTVESGSYYSDGTIVPSAAKNITVPATTWAGQGLELNRLFTDTAETDPRFFQVADVPNSRFKFILGPTNANTGYGPTDPLPIKYVYTTGDISDYGAGPGVTPLNDGRPVFVPDFGYGVGINPPAVVSLGNPTLHNDGVITVTDPITNTEVGTFKWTDYVQPTTGTIIQTGTPVADLIANPNTGNPDPTPDPDPNPNPDPTPDPIVNKVRNLVNLSTRKVVPAGERLILGFVVEGESQRQFLIRAVGPSLERFGVTGVMADPKLSVFTSAGSEPLYAVDDTSLTGQLNSYAEAAGAFTLTSTLDAATIVNLPPGAYTVHVEASFGAGGDVIAEVYDVTGLISGGLPEDYKTKAVNLSTRKTVASGDRLIVGFVINSDINKKVLVRAMGPTLTEFGVTGAMEDPVIQVFKGETQIRLVDNYVTTTELTTAVTGAGAFPAKSAKEAMVVLDLTPGAYTVHVTPKDGTVGGDVITEIYDATTALD